MLTGKKMHNLKFESYVSLGDVIEGLYPGKVSQLSLRDYFKESMKSQDLYEVLLEKNPKTCSCTSKDVHKKQTP